MSPVQTRKPFERRARGTWLESDVPRDAKLYFCSTSGVTEDFEFRTDSLCSLTHTW